MGLECSGEGERSARNVRGVKSRVTRRGTAEKQTKSTAYVPQRHVSVDDVLACTGLLMCKTSDGRRDGIK